MNFCKNLREQSLKLAIGQASLGSYCGFVKVYTCYEQYTFTFTVGLINMRREQSLYSTRNKFNNRTLYSPQSFISACRL